jgi:hypothetical protein
MFRIVFWDVLSCKMIVDHHFTRQYIPEDNSEHHTRCRENLKSHIGKLMIAQDFIILYLASPSPSPIRHSPGLLDLLYSTNTFIHFSYGSSAL